MISPPKRQGIDPHGSLLEPLWNLFRETILFPRWPSERKRQVFSELRGGRTRTRTLDPLIKSQLVPIAFGTSAHHVPLSCLDRPVTSKQLDIAQRPTGLVDQPRRPGDERPSSGMRRAAVQTDVAKCAVEPDHDAQRRHRTAGTTRSAGHVQSPITSTDVPYRPTTCAMVGLTRWPIRYSCAFATLLTAIWSAGSTDNSKPPMTDPALLASPDCGKL